MPQVKKKATLRRIAKWPMVEAAGIEPASIPDATHSREICCGNTIDPRAAPALHFGGNASQTVSPFDTALEAVIEAWPALPDPLRKAILGIVRSQGYGGD